MTVATTDNEVNHVGNGAITIFTFDYVTLDVAHIEVYLDGVKQSSGFTTVLNADQDTSPGGDVTFTTPPGSGVAIALIREVPYTQLTEYTPYDTFPALAHETALDKLTMMIQQGAGSGSDAVKFPASDPVLSKYLPDAASRANKAFHFDSSGEIVMATPSTVIDPSIQVISDVNSIANLRALDTTALSFPAVKVLVSGYYADGDGGGGVFYWDAASIEADNDGTIIKATATVTGRWKRSYDGMISVKHFGAKVDGGTNDTTAITNAEALSGITELFIPEGTCIVTSYVLTKQYRGPGFISVDGTVQPQNADWEYAQSNGNRSAIRYFDGDNIYVTDKSFTMSEFRVQGQYTRLKAPAWDQPNDYITASIAVNRFGSMSATRTENWHAAFACANQGDAAVSTQTVPFLRARSVAGSVITLGDAGVGDDELGGLLGAYTYTWTPSELVGLKVLVISEGVLAGKTNILGSRVTTITAATTTTITLADIGSIGARDWILPAPSGFNFFRYLGTFNVDILEVSNIYDDGRQVGWLGSANLNFTNNYTGSQPAAIAIKLGGYISPLATAVMLYSKYTLSTASTGDIFERFGGDISHLWDVRYDIKNETSSRSVRHNNIPIPFLWRQEYAYSNSGSLVASKGFDEHYPYGWVE